ncbi:Cgr1 domain-containing protein [Rhizoctonia solani]|uniref:rRNA-processing protein n=1 Tax=Rhizoctonia solani TaxID=456999 RepID=A0A8H8NT66_9AGAM|nr:Cgr1 domain-containing protein [Rhizoctonia solani]QRW18875.1 Cgr1 domain-containing protein [Rhizoctonia solani]
MTTPVIPMSPAQPVEAATHTEEADFYHLHRQVMEERVEKDGNLKRQLQSMRSHMQAGVRAKSWEARMRKTAAETAVKRLHKEMIEEKAAEAARRREVSQERKRVRAEKARLEELAAKMSAKKAERLRKRAGRSKKVNG